MRMRNVILTLVLALSLGLTACEFGQVEQGRCVAFNPETKTLLVVLDVNHDQRNPLPIRLKSVPCPFPAAA